MPNLNGPQQAALERDLALAWRHVFAASTEYHRRGEDHAGDDLVDISFVLRGLLERELKRGGRLRTGERR